ncbi:MAG: SUF system NifU family Fe-S cluster assembly protein [Alphaproteobacteria bacterium]|nr:SUF system NifU family Fe-S cluster assembly protein [Alphaproteobacteria bacterium]MCL2505408.1 SUF system NifU family Fe-S cluster assembly protein [Alphaproteobacteria bacterium]
MDNDLRELYQDVILDHGKSPRNFHAMANATNNALGHNPLCGDKIDLFLSIDKNNVIQDISFQGAGCAISMASASMMTEMLKGKTTDHAVKLFHAVHNMFTSSETDIKDCSVSEDDMDRLTALSGVKEFPIRVKCATLAWHTLDSALNNKKS